jgi:hypothetical protein
VDEPLQIVAGGTVIIGMFSVTTTVVVFVQPVAVIVPVTVYVVVIVGLAITDVPVVALNPVAGVHV